MTSAIFYYGRDLPSQSARTASLRQVKVVLQPYHPLLTSDRFAAYFPHCPLFVYWNPTGVPPDALRGVSQHIRLLDPDPVWNLARLDLHSAATRRFAVGRGLRALRESGSCVTGLFVDDLDLWSAAEGQDAAMAVISSVLAEAGQHVSLFVNRGFGLWPRMPGMDAVLLEEITPGLVDRMPEPDMTWVQRCVLPAVRQVRQRGTAIIGLTYETEPEQPPRCPAALELADLSDSLLHGCRSLDIWPKEVR
ncbi:MAG: hypothetical protein ACLPN6_23065 [Streptosporangiaceae bacterium]|jgi:hypothetical protein